MALQKAFTYKGLAIPACYFRVVAPQVDISKTTMSFRVWPFVTQDQSTDASNALADVTVVVAAAPYSLTGPNIFEQAYEYLKTLPEFEGATDVLEAGQTA